jgi:hypothetical protein
LVTDFDHDRATRLLLRDIEATIGTGYDAVVFVRATKLRTFIDDPPTYVQKLVDDVQQYFHDSFIDTTWPRCPLHPNHPLWLQDEGWRCTHERAVIAQLGKLKPTANRS